MGANALHQAIELNAVAVEFNKKAFQWGRRAAHDLNRVTECAEIKPPFKAIEKLDDIVADRYQRLCDYQDQKYAEHYNLLVDQVCEAEQSQQIDRDLAFSKAVARNLYKLMAYKDEYEVARLYSDPSFREELSKQFEGDYKLEFHLAPPWLAGKDSDTGLPTKRRFPQITLGAVSV